MGRAANPLTVVRPGSRPLHGIAPLTPTLPPLAERNPTGFRVPGDEGAGGKKGFGHPRRPKSTVSPAHRSRSIEFGHRDRLGAGATGAALERLLDDDSLGPFAGSAAVDLQQERTFFGVILAQSTPAETARAPGRLGAEPAGHGQGVPVPQRSRNPVVDPVAVADWLAAVTDIEMMASNSLEPRVPAGKAGRSKVKVVSLTFTMSPLPEAALTDQETRTELAPVAPTITVVLVGEQVPPDS
jgi:hypothetical protein